ncbi:hypothetical protein HIM_12310 [Hirsutella minnesotensis 3608]|uniref:Uncharacterized protein n=1 Tax=Hirsutella minnesotensis 3608 TaxID=1043627 RepID=A0A0F7ZW39_9HYPO|nr:hypothetical protein HIM_12310 [Hirsutella minnesotensis 3608]
MKVSIALFIFLTGLSGLGLASPMPDQNIPVAPRQDAETNSSQGNNNDNFGKGTSLPGTFQDFDNNGNVVAEGFRSSGPEEMKPSPHAGQGVGKLPGVPGGLGGGLLGPYPKEAAQAFGALFEKAGVKIDEFLDTEFGQRLKHGIMLGLCADPASGGCQAMASQLGEEFRAFKEDKAFREAKAAKEAKAAEPDF